MPNPTKPTPATKVVGLRTKFIGMSGEHAHLRGQDVIVIGVIRGAQTITPGVEHDYITEDGVLAACGGLDLAADRLDVAPVVTDPGAPGGDRSSFASSDVRPSDLEAFVTVIAATPRSPERTAEDYEKLRLIRQVEGSLARTGKMYQIGLPKLDTRDLREIVRLLRDLEYEQDSAVRRARTEPWRR